MKNLIFSVFIFLACLNSTSAIAAVIDNMHPWPKSNLAICWGIYGIDRFPDYKSNDLRETLGFRPPTKSKTSFLEKLVPGIRSTIEDEIKIDKIGIGIKIWERCSLSSTPDIVLILSSNETGCNENTVCGISSQIGYNQSPSQLRIDRLIREGATLEMLNELSRPKKAAAVGLNILPRNYFNYTYQGRTVKFSQNSSKQFAANLVALHEFGHILGLYHEEENQYYRALTHYETFYAQRVSGYDSNSIMNYNLIYPLINFLTNQFVRDGKDFLVSGSKIQENDLQGFSDFTVEDKTIFSQQSNGSYFYRVGFSKIDVTALRDLYFKDQ